MATRDHFTRQVECPKCKAKGAVHLSDDDHPYGKPSHREIEGVDGEFTVNLRRYDDINVTCKACKKTFPLYSETS